MTTYKVSGNTTGYMLVTFNKGKLKSLLLEYESPNDLILQFIQNHFPDKEEVMQEWRDKHLKVEVKGIMLSSTIGFAAFWQVWPKKVKRDRAIKEWGKLKQGEQAEVMDRLPLFTEGWKGIETRFIPNPDGWLKEKRWKEEPPKHTEKASTTKYPTHYDREFERKLTGHQLVGYRRHLREQGLKPVKNHTGTIIDWR